MSGGTNPIVAVRDLQSCGPLPARCWLANLSIPAAPCEAQGGAGERRSLLVDSGRIAAIEPLPAGDAPVLDLGGASAWSAFVDVHTHLDKGDLLAAGVPAAPTLLAAVEAARADVPTWTPGELRRRIDFGLRTACAWGTRAVNSHCDWPDEGLPLAWDVLQEARERWRGRVELAITGLADSRLMAHEAGGMAYAAALARGGARLGLFVHPGTRGEELARAFALARHHGLVLDLHVDEHLEPPRSWLGEIARLALVHGLRDRVLCSHACVLQAIDEGERDRTLDALAEAGVALACLPWTNLHLQDASSGPLRATPRRRGVLPLHEARARGIALAISSDNHRDPFFPAGDLDALAALALAALAAQLDDPVPRWSDTITSAPARMLGLAWDGVLRPGAPADLVLHPGRSSAEVLSRVAIGRRVVRAGQWLPAQQAQPPCLRELDDLRPPLPREVAIP